MMTRNPSNDRAQLVMLTIDQLVHEEPLVRKLESAIDFSFIYPLVENLYSGIGRQSDGQPYEVLKNGLCRRCLRLLP